MQTKQQLRMWAKEERKKLNIKSISQVLVRKLQNTDEYKNSKNIMLFHPKENEIDLRQRKGDFKKREN